MQKSILIILTFFLLPLGIKAQTNVMTFNIRYDNPNDGENQWNNRKVEVLDLLNYYSPEIFGIQEGLSHQVEYIDNKLSNYNYVGVGRDDGKTKGEYTAIYFDTDKVKLLKTETFWLSDTPDKISVGWDASMERICTYAKFKLKKDGVIMHVFNCHYDHIGNVARKKSSQLISDKIKENGLDKDKVIVMGDFNSEPQSEPIKTLSNLLKDGAEIASKPLYGSLGTFNSFKKDIIPTKRIDFIFTLNLKVNSYRHIDDKRKNGFCVSDHLPVLIEIKWDKYCN